MLDSPREDTALAQLRAVVRNQSLTRLMSAVLVEQPVRRRGLQLLYERFLTRQQRQSGSVAATGKAALTFRSVKVEEDASKIP